MWTSFASVEKQARWGSGWLGVPLPASVAFELEGIEAGSYRARWRLRGARPENGAKNSANETPSANAIRSTLSMPRFRSPRSMPPTYV